MLRNVSLLSREEREGENTPASVYTSTHPHPPHHLHPQIFSQVTTGIQSEVYSQHTILDNMSFSMSGIQMGLGASRDKFNKVMNDPQGRQVIYMAGIAAVVLFVLYLYMTRG